MKRNKESLIARNIDIEYRQKKRIEEKLKEKEEANHEQETTKLLR